MVKKYIKYFGRKRGRLPRVKKHGTYMPNNKRPTNYTVYG